MRNLGAAATLVLAVAAAEPAAAQQVRAGLLTCDVSAGIGLIITSQKQLTCTFAPDRSGIMREDYDGTITKYGLDLGVIGGGIMVWVVFTETVAGPGFLAGEYVGASGEASLGAGVGANVLIGGSNRTVTLQPLSLNELVFHRATGTPGYSLLSALGLVQVAALWLTYVGVRVWSGRSTLFCLIFTLLPTVLIYGVWAFFAFRGS